MSGWNALPPEIHHHILRLFCKDIVDKYTALGSNPHHYDRWTAVSELRFPAAPSCLRHISSAIKVCRFFYYSLVCDIKIDSVPAMEHLRKLQLSKVRAIADYFAQRPIDRMHYGRLPVHVGVFIKLAGIFWKNSLILEYHVDIATVLRMLHKSSVMLLLPHLKEWVDRHSMVEEEDCEVGYRSVCQMNEPGSRDVTEVTFGNGAKGSRHLDDDMDNLNIYTITGLYRGTEKQRIDMWDRYGPDESLYEEDLLEFQTLSNDECRHTYPILQLVDDAKPDTWWVCEWNHAGAWEWLLINFEKRTVWHRHMRNVVCVWNGGDGMWEPKEWALAEAVDRQDRPTKTILEVVEETGVCVDNEGNWENEKDGTESDTDDDDFNAFEYEDDGDARHGHWPWQSINFSDDQLFLAFSKAFQ